jgi:thioredoxin 1
MSSLICWLNRIRLGPPFVAAFSLLSLIAIVMSTGCEKQPAAIERDERVMVTDESYDSLVEQSEKPVVIEFTAQWCRPCRDMEPIVAALSVERSDVRFAVVDVDKAVKLAVKYRVTSIPCFVFFKNGEVVGREVGSLSRSELESLVEKYFLHAVEPATTP